jgi:hypothetical protein
MPGLDAGPTGAIAVKPAGLTNLTINHISFTDGLRHATDGSLKDDWPTNARRATSSRQGNPVAAAVTSLELTSAVSVAGGVRPRTIGSHGQILPSREAFTDPADSGRLPHPIGENGVKT